MKRALLTGLALGAFVVENAFDFVGSVPYFRRITGGLGILDMLPLPDAERAHRALALLGPEGRHRYAVLLLTFDIVFPLTVALFFRAWLPVRLRWLPWATLALDYAENVACGVLVGTFPNESPVVASLAGTLTAVKFLGYASCLLALVFSSWSSRTCILQFLRRGRYLRDGGESCAPVAMRNFCGPVGRPVHALTDAPSSAPS